VRRRAGPGGQAGESISFDPTQIHRLMCETETAISIHAYSATDGDLIVTRVVN
jgi:hypothetical protein